MDKWRNVQIRGVSILVELLFDSRHYKIRMIHYKQQGTQLRLSGKQYFTYFSRILTNGSA